jgi:hypothetical protein
MPLDIVKARFYKRMHWVVCKTHKEEEIKR